MKCAAMKNHEWNAFPNVWFAFTAASVTHGVLTCKGQWHETSIKSFSTKINQSMLKITVILLKGWQILFGTETENTLSTHKSRCHRKKQQDFFIVSFPTPSAFLLWYHCFRKMMNTYRKKIVLLPSLFNTRHPSDCTNSSFWWHLQYEQPSAKPEIINTLLNISCLTEKFWNGHVWVWGVVCLFLLFGLVSFYSKHLLA